MQEKSQIWKRKIRGENGHKMFKMTKAKPCDKRILSPKLVEKSCGKPGKFRGKGGSGGVIREFSKCVFHKLWRKNGQKMALFCVSGGESAHFRGYILCSGKFSTKLVRSAVELSEWGTVFHRPGEKEERQSKIGETETKKPLDKRSGIWYTFLV